MNYKVVTLVVAYNELGDKLLGDTVGTFNMAVFVYLLFKTDKLKSMFCSILPSAAIELEKADRLQHQLNGKDGKRDFKVSRNFLLSHAYNTGFTQLLHEPSN